MIADPVGLVVRKHLDATRIRDVVCQVSALGPVAAASPRPFVMTVAAADGPPASPSLRRQAAERAAGAQDIARPRCAECDRERNWVASLRGGQRPAHPARTDRPSAPAAANCAAW